MHRATLSAVLCSALVAAACGTDAPTSAAPLAAAHSSSAARAPQSGGGFFTFLQPLVSSPDKLGTFDDSRLVSVVVRPLGTPPFTCDAPIQPIGGMPAEVHGNQYMVVWHLGELSAPLSGLYRLSVIDDGSHAEYGFVDVYVGDARDNPDPAAFTTLNPRQSVPVKFWLAREATPNPCDNGGTPT